MANFPHYEKTLKVLNELKKKYKGDGSSPSHQPEPFYGSYGFTTDIEQNPLIEDEFYGKYTFDTVEPVDYPSSTRRPSPDKPSLAHKITDNKFVTMPDTRKESLGVVPVQMPTTTPTPQLSAPTVKIPTDTSVPYTPAVQTPAQPNEGRYAQSTSFKDRRAEAMGVTPSQPIEVQPDTGMTAQEALALRNRSNLSAQEALALRNTPGATEAIKDFTIKQQKPQEPMPVQPTQADAFKDITPKAVLEQAETALSDAGKWLGTNLMAGVAQGNYGFYNALESIGGDQIPGVKDVLELGREQSQQIMGKGGQDFGSKLVQGVPDAVTSLVLGLMTGGTSTVASLPTDTMAMQYAKNIVKNPMFWDTFVKTYGSAYGQAVEAGSDRGTAITAAVLEALPTALSEISGGIEDLPNKDVKNLWQTILETGKEEFGEELMQYPFAGAAKRATYAPNTPLFSMEGEAIINPLEMGESAALGGILGGAMGGVSAIGPAIRGQAPALEADNIPAPQNYSGVKYDQAAKAFKAADGQSVDIDLNNITRSGISNILNSGVENATAVPIEVFDVLTQAQEMAIYIDTTFPQLMQMAKAMPETSLSRQMANVIEQYNDPTPQQLNDLAIQLRIDASEIAAQNGSGVSFTEQEASQFIPVDQEPGPIIEQQTPIQPTVPEYSTIDSKPQQTASEKIPVTKSKVDSGQAQTVKVYRYDDTDIETFRTDQNEEGVIFFSSKPETAESYGGKPREYNVTIKNPLVLDAKGKTWQDEIDGLYRNEWIEKAKAEGYDAVIIENVVDVGGMTDAVDPDTIYAVFSPDQIAPQATKQVGSDSNKNVAFHAGDLGKSEFFGNQYGSNRGTGHFGTGTYFVGNKENLNTGSYKERPIHEVDLNDYNLYKPGTESDAQKLHDLLKYTNTYYQYGNTEPLSYDDIRSLKGDPAESYKVLSEYDVLDEGSFKEATGHTLKEVVDQDLWDGDIADELEKQIERLRVRNDKLRQAKSYRQTFNDNVQDLFGISQKEANKILSEIYADVQKQMDGKDIYTMGDLSKSDSISTRFMKALGYEGVDVRHIPSFDNTGYGTVVYDLKTKSATQQPSQRVTDKLPVDETKPAQGESAETKPDKYNGLKVGDNVSFTDHNGKTLTGTIKRFDDYSSINPRLGIVADVDVDQVATYGGGVPIGRREMVSVNQLSLIKSTAESELQKETKSGKMESGQEEKVSSFRDNLKNQLDATTLTGSDKNRVLDNFDKLIKGAKAKGIDVNLALNIVSSINDTITEDMLKAHNIKPGEKAYIAGKTEIKKSGNVMNVTMSLFADPNQPITQEIIHEFAEVWTAVWEAKNPAEVKKAIDFLVQRGATEAEAREMLPELITDHSIYNDLGYVENVYTEEKAFNKLIGSAVDKFKKWVQQIIRRITYFRERVWRQLPNEIKQQAREFTKGNWEFLFDGANRLDINEFSAFSIKRDSSGKPVPFSTPKQEIWSSDTSRPQQLPRTVTVGKKHGWWKPGTVNFDNGSGRTVKQTATLQELGVTNVTYDPFNLDIITNRIAIDKVRGGKADTSTINNVLNVIQEAEDREGVIANTVEALKEDGTAYICVYYDNAKVGKSESTTDGFQMHQPTSFYVPEVQKYFKDVKIVDDIIVAKYPKKEMVSSVKENFQAPVLMRLPKQLPFMGKFIGTTVSKYGIGKDVMGKVYIHKTAVNDLVRFAPQKYKEAAKNLVSKYNKALATLNKSNLDFGFDVVRISENADDVGFIKSPDFDTNPEPVIGDSISVIDGNVGKITKAATENPLIYHNKGIMVSPEYTGFNRDNEIMRYVMWNAAEIPESSGGAKNLIGRQNYWEKVVIPKFNQWLSKNNLMAYADGSYSVKTVDGDPILERYERLFGEKGSVKDGKDKVSTDKIGAGIPEASEDVSTKPVSKPGEIGETDGNGLQQAGGNEGTGRRPDGKRNESRPSDGSGAESNAVRDRAGAGKQPSVKNQSNPKGNDYVINTQEDSVTNSGKKTRYKDNVEAIRVLKKIESKNRTATPEEQKILAKYVGWGGIPEAFATESRWNSEKRVYESVPKKDWESEYNELKSLLTDEEHHSAHNTILNAHYTSIDVIKAIYDGLRHFGFDGGKVLEPAVGIGNFIGSMPIDMRNKVRVMTGVEIDSITGRIAKLLYPNADIRVQGFEDAKLPGGYYDVAISNVPFGKIMINDSKYPKSITRAIHNYFFAKALDVVRPGGIVMFITSSKTMDSSDTSGIRAYIKSKADLIGAVRLPNTAFKENAMTEVTTDLLILKVREPGTDYSGEAFSNMGTMEMQNDYYNGTFSQEINEYFVNHPENVLGELHYGKNMYAGADVYVKGDNRDIRKALSNALLAMPSNVITKATIEEPSTAQGSRSAGKASKNTKNGSYEIVDGKLAVNKDGELVEVEETFSPQEMKRISGLIEIKNTARELHNLLLENGDAKKIAEARKKLNKLYDQFVEKHGYINRKENVKLLFDDPDINFLRSLEVYTKPKKANAKLGTPAITESAKKADIFTKDTVSSKKVINSVSTSKEALIVSLNETGTIDLQRMADLTQKSEQKIITELAGHIYKNPVTGTYETAEEYLSGNVKAKLKEAEARAIIEPEYTANVEALKAVQPADKESWQISLKLGSSLVNSEIYQEFAKHLFGKNAAIEIVQTQHNGEWIVREDEGRRSRYFSVKNSTENTARWGINVRGFRGLELLEKIMNNRSIIVNRVYEDANGRKVKVNDPEATALAQERAEKIKQEFTEWLNVHNDGKTLQEIVQYYNEVFNTDVLRKYDGSHLPDVLEGMNTDPFGSGSFKIAPHQKDAIWRIVSSSGNTLLAHEVGAGKTLEMVASIMELRRIGIIKKAMVVVPNNVYEQWGVEFNRFYPGAKILLPIADDFKASNRKTLMNRIATGTYDAVIIPESQFSMLPMSEDTVRNFYMEKIRELRTALEIMVAEKGDKNRRSEKRITNAIKNLETKMKAKIANAKKDRDNINFEQLGVDALFVDEAHRFKNLMYTTHLQVSGLGNPDGSDKAFDLLMKTRYLQQLNGGKGIVFATATPLLNSIAEVYNWMQYLAPDLLKSRGLHSFDAWASVFAKIETVAEVKPEGSGYRVKNGISKITNVGQLAKMFRMFTDFKTQDDLKLPRPDVKGGKYETISVPATEWLKSYMKELADRAEAVRTGQVKPDEDNMLKITTDGRKAALDPRLVDPSFELGEGEVTKIDAAVEHLYSKWKETKKEKLTHLVFIEFSTPRTESNIEQDADNADTDTSMDSIYQELKRRLVAKGIPANEIAFIHDAKNADQKLALQTAFNEGKIRILIGNNEKMGVGINLQKRTKTITHIDFPWRPKDLQQEDGRGLRQGNMNSEIEMYVMVTEGSFDARLWDNLQRKSKLVDDMLTADLDAVEIEDVGVQTLSAQEVVGIASGNPLMQEQIVVSQKLTKLRALERGYIREKQENQRKLATAQGEVIALGKEIASWSHEFIESIKDTKGDLFAITINGKSFDVRKEADAYLNELKEKSTLKVLKGEEVKYVIDFAGIVNEVKFKLNTMKSVYPEFSYSNGNSVVAHTMEDLERHIRKTLLVFESTKQRLDQTKKSIKELQKELQKMFPHSEEIRQLAVREQELMRILNPEQVLNESAVEEDDNDSDIQAMYFNEDATGDNDISEEIDRLTGNHNMLPQSKGTSTEAKTMDQIINELERFTGVPIKTGRFSGSKSVLGVFKNKEDVIRVRVSNDISTIAHELGHYMDKEFNIRDLKTIKAYADGMGDPKLNRKILKALEALGQQSSPPGTTNKGYLRKEGIAEALRRYLSEPDTLDADVLDYFMSRADGKTKDFLDGLQKDVLDVINLPDELAVKNTISTGENRTSRRQHEQSWKDKILTAWVDSYTPIRRLKEAIEGVTGQKLTPGKDFYEKAKLYRGGLETKLEHDLEFGQTDLDGKIVGKSLREILELIKDKNEYEDFVSYMVSRRAADYKDKGFVMPLPYDVYERNVKKYESQYKHFKQVFDDIRAFEDNAMHLLVEAGIMTERDYQKIKDANPNHVPLYRIMDDAEQSARGRGNSLNISANVVKRAHGSGKTIIDPIEGIVSNALAFRKAAEANNVKRIMVKQAAEKNLGRLVEKVPPHKRTIKFDFQEIKNQLLQAYDDLFQSGKIDDPVDIDSMDIDLMLRIYRPDYNAMGNDIVVYDNGKPQLYELAPELKQALSGVYSGEIMNKVIRVLSIPTNVIRAGVTMTVPFIMRNAMRDTGESVINSKVGITLDDIIKGYNEARKKGDLYQDFIAHGGGTAWFNPSNRKDFQAKIGKAMGYKFANKVGHFMQNPSLGALADIFNHLTSNISEAIEFSELGPRLAEYEKALAKGYSKQEAAAMARDLTIDFKQSGTWGKQVNRVVAFFNPQMQGYYKTYKMLQNPETRYKVLLKGFLNITLPSLLLWLLNEDNEEYQSMAWFRKMFFFNIPLATPEEIYDKLVNGKKLTNKHFISIPMPFNYGVMFGASPTAILDQIKGNDPEALEDLKKAYVETFLNTELVPQMFRGTLEVAANKRWTGAPVETYSDKEKEPYARYDENTSEFAKKVGELSRLLIDGGISPKKVDYLIKSYFGTLGEGASRIPEAVQAVDQVIETVKEKGVDAALKEDFITDPQDIPVLRKFITTPIDYPQELSDFYDLKEKIDQKYNTLREEKKMTPEVVKAYNILNYAYNGMHNKTATVNGIKDLYEAVKRIRNNKNMSKATRDREVERLMRIIRNKADKALEQVRKIYK